MNHVSVSQACYLGQTLGDLVTTPEKMIKLIKMVTIISNHHLEHFFKMHIEMVVLHIDAIPT